jgi:hypothetical protein
VYFFPIGFLVYLYKYSPIMVWVIAWIIIGSVALSALRGLVTSGIGIVFFALSIMRIACSEEIDEEMDGRRDPIERRPDDIDAPAFGVVRVSMKGS